MTPGVQELVEQIHTTPHKVVLEFAGAGAMALQWLHCVGGSSRTVLEATDRYSPASLTDLLGFMPAQFVTPVVAQAMATQAYARACHLTETNTVVLGVGCTATIATDRKKQGKHRCCVAVCQADGITSYELILTKGLRDRYAEEELVSLLILQAITTACGVITQLQLPLACDEQMSAKAQTSSLPERLIQGDFPLLLVSAAGRQVPYTTLPNVTILSGSFNPLHQGHHQMALVAAQRLGQQVYFELPLLNAEKAPIDLAEAERRIAQFADVAPVILSTAPLFNQKSELYPHSTFILGADTVRRLVEPSFYQNNSQQMHAAFEQVRWAGCRFLVAGRYHQGQLLTLSDIEIPAPYLDLFIEIPLSEFRLDISSTVLRSQ